MKTLLAIFLSLILSSAKAQQLPTFDAQQYFKKKNEEQLRKLKLNTITAYKDTTALKYSELMKEYLKTQTPNTLYFMPIITEQRPTLGVMPVVIEQIPMLGVMPGAKGTDPLASIIHQNNVIPNGIVIPKPNQ